MTKLFSQILNMSMTGSAVILAVLTARLALRKAPKIYSYALWSVVLFRLLCPVSLTVPSAPMGLLQPQVAQSGGISTMTYAPVEAFQPDAGQPKIPPASQPGRSQETPGEEAPKAVTEAAFDGSLLDIAAGIWAAGGAALLLSSLIPYFLLRRRLRDGICCQENIWLSSRISMPFVLGLLRPRIYLPASILARERPYIIAHERHHIRRGDHFLKAAAYGALCLHWFNPLVWLAFCLAGTDMEMSCDEAVIRKLGQQIRADYAQSLLRLASHRRRLTGMPLAFGEGDTKGRVKNMARWKYPKTWVAILSALICAAVLAACAVNPEKQEETADASQTEAAGSGEENLTIGMKLPLDMLPQNCGDEEIQFFLTEPIPGAISTQISSTEPLGGIRVYPAPQLSLEDMEGWLREVGVPQILDGGYDHMASGSEYGDLEVCFIDANARQTQHDYYIRGEQVFEVWYDTEQLDAMTRAAMRESVCFGQEAVIERGLPGIQTASAGEQAAGQNQEGEEMALLQRCREALEQLQSQESYSVKLQKDNYGGPGLNDTSLTYYHQSGEDWLMLTQVPDEGFESGYGQFGYLFADGAYYQNASGGWEPMDGQSLRRPWPGAFNWDAQQIQFISALSAGEGQCITLEVMAPYYPGREGSYESYQMQLFLDKHGKLDRVENTFFFHDDFLGDYSSKETIQPIQNRAKTEIGLARQQQGLQ